MSTYEQNQAQIALQEYHKALDAGDSKKANQYMKDYENYIAMAQIEQDRLNKLKTA